MELLILRLELNYLHQLVELAQKISRKGGLHRPILESPRQKVHGNERSKSDIFVANEVSKGGKYRKTLLP